MAPWRAPSSWEELVVILERIKGQLVQPAAVVENMLIRIDPVEKALVLFRGTDEEILARLKVYASPGSTMLSPQATSHGREAVAAFFVENLGDPSSYADTHSTRGWTGKKMQEKKMYRYLECHRQAESEDNRPLPVHILDPVLAQVAYDAEHGIPSSKDCQFVVKVASVMSAGFKNKDARVEAFHQLFLEGFGYDLHHIEIGQSMTDGSLRASGGGLVLNLVVRNEMGEGGEEGGEEGGTIHVQNAAWAGLYVATKEHIRQMSVCPMLLIELAGPNMSLSGACFSDRLICDQLTPMVSLLWLPHSVLMLQAARCFLAIRNALPLLLLHYDSLRTSRVPERLGEVGTTYQLGSKQFEFPYPVDYTTSECVVVKFRYVRRIKESLCFEGRDVGGQQLFIKFCKSYSCEAQQLLVAAGCAPKIFAFRELVGGWKMVVMEYVSCQPWNNLSPEKPISALWDAVQVLHGGGFVHGDLREGNVLVTDEGVCIVDFEWAGCENEVRYPFLMNHLSVEWPDGATDGALILKEHDLDWVARLSVRL